VNAVQWVSEGVPVVGKEVRLSILFS
jgi:hypothetical protein